MTAVDFTDDDLAEGRALVLSLDGAQWALGDLAIRVAGPAQFTRAHDGSVARLSVFADAIGLHHEQLARYRTVATAWPPESRVEGASWTLHRTLAPLEGRQMILSEFILACDLGGTKPTRDLLLRKLRTQPILPEEEPNVVPALAQCLEALPDEVTVPVPARRTEMHSPQDMVQVEAPLWMEAELAHIRITAEGTTNRSSSLTVNEAMAQLHELEARVAALNEYRRVLLFAITAKRPSWWTELEPKLERMDTEEQFLLDA